MSKKALLQKSILYPTMVLSFNIDSGDTVLFFESSQLTWKVAEHLKSKKSLIDNLKIQTIICVDSFELLETFNSNTSLFIPEKTKSAKNLFYLGNISTLGIKTFSLLKENAKVPNLKPWFTIYKKLLNKTYETNSFSSNKLDLKQDDLKKFLSYFDDIYKHKIERLFSEKKSINQIILSNEDFF